jgi:hypothetical protein
MGSPERDDRKTFRQRRRTLRIKLGRMRSNMPRWLQAAAAIIVTGVLAAVGTLVYNTIHDAFTDKFRVTVESNPDRITTRTGALGGSYVIAKSIQSIGAPPNKANNCIGRYDWAHSIGGIDADSTSARVTIEGTTDNVVQIKGIAPKIISSSPPSVGSHLTCPGRGGSPEVRSVAIDLDAKPPTALTVDKTGAVVPFFFTVNKGQTETFDISAITAKCDCEWNVEISVNVDGKDETFTIMAKGSRNFRTTSSLDAKMYQWIDGRWTDVATAPQLPQPSAAPEDLPKSVPDVCRYAAPLAVPLLAAPVKTSTDAASVRLGAAQIPLRHSGCSYFSQVPPPSPLPPNGTLSDSVTVWLDGAKDGDGAKKELQALVAGYSSNHPPMKIDEPRADEAYLFPGVFVASKGRLILTVQVSSARKSFEGNARTLGHTLLERVA